MTGTAPLEVVHDPGRCSSTIRIVLEEGGFASRAHRVSARGADRDTVRPEWTARNPNGRVPAPSPVACRAGGGAALVTEVRPSWRGWRASGRSST